MKTFSGDVSTFVPREVQTAATPHQVLIDHVERLLVDAKSGKLQALATAQVYGSGNVVDDSINNDITTAGRTLWALNTSVMILADRVKAEVNK